MYPFLRMTLQLARWRKQALDPWGTHVSRHRILPWDLDMFAELNNGLTLTIYDLGRIPFAYRTGAFQTFKKNGLYLTIAGSCIRYRRRITGFQLVEQRTRIAGWDSRFIYFDQSLWVGDDCAGQGVFRAAIVRNGKMVPLEEEVIPLLDSESIHANRPHLPGWIAAWAEAEAKRPWPPEAV
ncbi:thioeseterase [Pseudooceanicola sp. 216_PA32_1]|uniref:Thioeseterase n=1 Tax=Pseudooceanicola pacificus TaxID=2676438 RepID=A0A844W7V3_9RHOB|nr:acyl-CoA thioesterase [Pseudooceanicola pacificus]MWB76518.1 thioeseterase [Pseudooceanicola pacificus]